MSIINSFSEEYSFLSNFTYSPIVENGVTYPTVEHAFQALKTLDLQERQKVVNCTTPGRAKRMGATMVLRSDWEKIKVHIMRTLLILKFNIPEFRKQLLATGDATIIEGNRWHDNFWGDCVCPECTEPDKNILGELLMEIRSNL